MQIIDADGHVNDRPCMEEIFQVHAGQEIAAKFCPAFDHIHSALAERAATGAARTGNVGPGEWVNFLDEVGIDWTVVCSTAGLAVGHVVAKDSGHRRMPRLQYWLYEKVTNVNPHMNLMALIPIQDTEAACAELRRAVKELTVKTRPCCHATAKASKATLARKYTGRFKKKRKNSTRSSASP